MRYIVSLLYAKSDARKWQKTSNLGKFQTNLSKLGPNSPKLCPIGLCLISGWNTTDVISLRYMQWHEYVRSRPKDVSHLVPFAHAKRTGKVIARLPLRYWCSLTHPVGGHPPWIITEKTQGGHTRRNWWIFWYLEIWIKNQEKVFILILNCSHLNHFFIFT